MYAQHNAALGPRKAAGELPVRDTRCPLDKGRERAAEFQEYGEARVPGEAGGAHAAELLQRRVQGGGIFKPSSLAGSWPPQQESAIAHARRLQARAKSGSEDARRDREQAIQERVEELARARVEELTRTMMAAQAGPVAAPQPAQDALPVIPESPDRSESEGASWIGRLRSTSASLMARGSRSGLMDVASLAMPAYAAGRLAGAFMPTASGADTASSIGPEARRRVLRS